MSQPRHPGGKEKSHPNRSVQFRSSTGVQTIRLSAMTPERERRAEPYLVPLRIHLEDLAIDPPPATSLFAPSAPTQVRPLLGDYLAILPL